MNRLKLGETASETGYSESFRFRFSGWGQSRICQWVSMNGTHCWPTKLPTRLTAGAEYGFEHCIRRW